MQAALPWHDGLQLARKNTEGDVMRLVVNGRLIGRDPDGPARQAVVPPRRLPEHVQEALNGVVDAFFRLVRAVLELTADGCRFGQLQAG